MEIYRLLKSSIFPCDTCSFQGRVHGWGKELYKHFLVNFYYYYSSNDVSFLRLVKSFALIYKFIFFLIFKFFYFDHVNTIKLAITSEVVLPVP